MSPLELVLLGVAVLAAVGVLRLWAWQAQPAMDPRDRVMRCLVDGAGAGFTLLVAMSIGALMALGVAGAVAECAAAMSRRKPWFPEELACLVGALGALVAVGQVGASLARPAWLGVVRAYGVLAFAAAAGAGTALSPAHDAGEWAPVATLLAVVGAAALGGVALLAPRGASEACDRIDPPPARPGRTVEGVAGPGESADPAS